MKMYSVVCDRGHTKLLLDKKLFKVADPKKFHYVSLPLTIKFD